jgi:hypothetical protein
MSRLAGTVVVFGCVKQCSIMVSLIVQISLGDFLEFRVPWSLVLTPARADFELEVLA